MEKKEEGIMRSDGKNDLITSWSLGPVIKKPRLSFCQAPGRLSTDQDPQFKRQFSHGLAVFNMTSVSSVSFLF